MNKINFLFAIHNHQPVGNFGHVLEEVFQVCYQPYFEVLKKFPKLKTTAHFSGPLLEWLKQNRADYLKMLKDMVQAGRLEILSGGFYEPLLSTLPEEDAIGQIQMMNQFIETEFGSRPRGLWLAERIWNPDLPRIIAKAGIQYTIVDDTHFYYSGLEENQMQGYYITERLGYPLFLFPISKELRYGIPFKMPEETLATLRRAKDELGFSGMTYADDGEKFGSWPDTFHWVYKEKWLEKFFTAINDNNDWVETLTFSEYIDAHSPSGRIYLPMASYDEMMEWSLPTNAQLKFKWLKEELQTKDVQEERYKIFLRGGQWDNFLTKYEESNLLHKKMLFVSRKVKKLSLKDQESSTALKELYQGQCNCAQWHGMFGGLYLNYLRHALYQHLLKAENIVDEKIGHEFSHETFDYNLDGKDEILVSNQKMNALMAPAQGGALMEIDYRPKCFNLSNVLKRREEIYHKTIMEPQPSGNHDEGQPQSIHDQVKFKEEGLQNKIFFDRFERYSFLDHFIGPDTTLENFKQCRYEEEGDFVDQPYEKKPATQTEKGFSLILKRDGLVTQHGNAHPVQLEKKFIFSKTEADIQAHYKIENTSAVPLSLWWGVEFNFTLLAGDARDRYYICPGHSLDSNRLISEGTIDDVANIAMRDDWHKFQLSIDFSPAVSLWRFPVETISQSEGGFERTYQGSCLLAHRKLTLAPGQSAKHNFTLKVS